MRYDDGWRYDAEDGADDDDDAMTMAMHGDGDDDAEDGAYNDDADGWRC